MPDLSIAQWNSESLPKDDLSIQNGILVTEATRYPLIIGPFSISNRAIRLSSLSKCRHA